MAKFDTHVSIPREDFDAVYLDIVDAQVAAAKNCPEVRRILVGVQGFFEKYQLEQAALSEEGDGEG